MVGGLIGFNLSKSWVTYRRGAIDFNESIAGSYFVSSDTDKTDAPINANGILACFPLTTQYVIQAFAPISNDHLYLRKKAGSGFGAWKIL